MNSNTIYVTKPFLPPKEEFDKYVEEIWETRNLTNSGKFHQKLEGELATFLGVKYISLFSNATIALIVALRALKISGEVITTPFSFVATSHALVWNGIKPVFVDIEAEGFNLDPARVESAITDKTTAILAVHCYGYPANVEALATIAKKHNLHLIYDAAHAFGVQINGDSVLNFGDLSILSFHATKVFNTFEGGAIVCETAEMKNEIDSLKNFGFVDEVSVNTIGINGKMAEINAALGLAQLPHFKYVLDQRQRVDAEYRSALMGIKGVQVYPIGPNITHNYSYFPISIKAEYGLTRDELFEEFRKNKIMVRRYFYPLITDFSVYQELIPKNDTSFLGNAAALASKILCLPIYPDLKDEQISYICQIIKTGSCK